MSTRAAVTGAGARLAAVVAGVVRQAVGDAGAAGVVVLDDGSAEARLAAEWCRAGVGEAHVWPVACPPSETVEAVGGLLPGSLGAALAGRPAELHRLAGRLAALERGALLAHPVNKTALLLGAAAPPEPLLPLGDVYASQVQELAGSWAAPPEVMDLAGLAGGIEALDRALAGLVEQRRRPDAALAALQQRARAAVLAALGRGRFARRRIGLVPKLTSRTLGVDYFG